MFLGEYKLNFTGKGRIALPKKFREQLGEQSQVVLSRGLDNCIWGFAKSAWEAQAAIQLERPVTDKEARDLRRYLFSAAVEIDVDAQGRIVIPAQLLAFAGIRKEPVVIGAGDHFAALSSVARA